MSIYCTMFPHPRAVWVSSCYAIPVFPGSPFTISLSVPINPRGHPGLVCTFPVRICRRCPAQKVPEPKPGARVLPRRSRTVPSLSTRPDSSITHLVSSEILTLTGRAVVGPHRAWRRRGRRRR